MQKILSTFENKEYCLAVFLDVKQAFDKVWHDGLLYKLKNLLTAPLFMLMKSFLNKRSFHVRVGSTHSANTSILAGVPQGSVLGPILYTIFTADLPTPLNDDVMVMTQLSCLLLHHFLKLLTICNNILLPWRHGSLNGTLLLIVKSRPM